MKLLAGRVVRPISHATVRRISGSSCRASSSSCGYQALTDSSPAVMRCEICVNACCALRGRSVSVRYSPICSSVSSLPNQVSIQNQNGITTLAIASAVAIRVALRDAKASPDVPSVAMSLLSYPAIKKFIWRRVAQDGRRGRFRRLMPLRPLAFRCFPRELGGDGSRRSCQLDADLVLTQPLQALHDCWPSRDSMIDYDSGEDLNGASR